MKIFNYFFGAVLLLSLAGCDDFLDPAKDGKLEDKDVWETQTRYSFGILNNAYTNLPGGYNRISGAMLAAASDEACHSDLASDIKGFNNDTWGPYFLIENVWENHYKGIHKVNDFFENIDRVPIPKQSLDGSSEELIRTRERMKGEAHFLRALFYFELLKRYGGVPLITRTLTPNEAKAVTRQSYDSCMVQIIKDCDSATVRLPERYIASGATVGFNEARNLGRVTKIAAMALKSKALLYWASPLNNPTNDKYRYKAAADAAQAVIQSKIPTVLDFYKDQDESYTDLYVVSQYFPQYNKEIIFSTSYSANTSIEQQNALITTGGKGLTNPTQNLANAFGMKNGKPIGDPTSGYDKTNPYADRDPRFYMTIAHNAADYSLNGKTTKVETFTGGKDAAGTNKTATRTGYYLKKFLSKKAVWDGSSNNVTRTWIYMRYPEVLLNYAEAMNEYSDTPGDSVYIAIELIRKRYRFYGLSPYTIPRGKTKEEMRELIRNERQVELAFEEHRFFDVRRWRLLDDPVQKNNYLNIKGVRITKNGDTFTYEEYPVETRFFLEKMYRYPVPQTERLKAPGIDPNPGWD
jgi:hypothetical protein